MVTLGGPDCDIKGPKKDETFEKRGSISGEYLVGGLVAIFYFPIYWEFLIIPPDFHIFQRGG